MSRTFLFFTLAMLLCALAPGLRAAETVHLYLKLDGSSINGESTQTSLGRENSIECIAYEQGVAVPIREGLAAGAPVASPITVLKRIDRSSPLLMKAVSTGQAAEGEFRFFRPNPAGDGTTQQFFTVAFKKARIISVRQFVPNTIIPGTSADPPQEEVKIACGSITYLYTSGGVTSTVQADGSAVTRSGSTTAATTTTPEDAWTAEAQPPTDDGKLNQPYALGKDQPLHFTLRRMDYTTAQVNLADMLAVPAAKEKLLVLHFALKNPNTREMRVRFDTLDIKAIDATNLASATIGRWGVEGSAAGLDTILLPAQQVEGYAVVRVSAKGAVPRLRVAPRDGSAALAFDLRDKVTALPAPIADPADPSGATARLEVPGAFNAEYPYWRYAATLEKTEFTTAPLLGRTPPVGGRFLVCTLLATNRSPLPAMLRFDTFVAKCFTGTGEAVPFGGTLLLATEDRRVEQQVKPGGEMRVRLYFVVSKGVVPKTVTLAEGESREYQFTLPTRFIGGFDRLG